MATAAVVGGEWPSLNSIQGPEIEDLRALKFVEAGHPREWEAASRAAENGLDHATDVIARRSAAQAGPALAAHGF